MFSVDGSFVGNGYRCFDSDAERNWCYDLSFANIMDVARLTATPDVGNAVSYMLPIYKGSWLSRLFEGTPPALVNHGFKFSLKHVGGGRVPVVPIQQACTFYEWFVVHSVGGSLNPDGSIEFSGSYFRKDTAVVNTLAEEKQY